MECRTSRGERAAIIIRPMPRQDQVAIYQGMHMNCVLLMLELVGNGIDAEVDVGNPGDSYADSLVVVNEANATRAQPIVAEFERARRL